MTLASGVGHMRRGAVDGAHVLESLDVWPVRREDAPAEGIDFNLECDLKSSPLKPQIKAADAAEQ